MGGIQLRFSVLKIWCSILTAGLYLISATCPVKAEHAQWVCENPIPGDCNFWGVWGTSGSNVFFVGEDGRIVHYDGVDLSYMPNSDLHDLFGIWGSSGSNIFAVGEFGTVINYDGHDWSKMMTFPY